MSIGKKTTEFWLIVATAVTMLVNGSDYVNVDPDTMRWFLGLVGVYTGGRSFVKGKKETL